MNLQFYIEKLHDSEEYKKFMKENTDAFMCSGFLIIDKEGKDNKQHLDFYSPSKKKIFSFELGEEIKIVPIDLINDQVPEKIKETVDFNFEKVEEIIDKKVEEGDIKNKVQKILLSLQNIEGKDSLVGTVFISGLGLIKIQIDVEKMEIIEFEKKSFFDIIRKK